MLKLCVYWERTLRAQITLQVAAKAIARHGVTEQ